MSQSSRVHWIHSPRYWGSASPQIHLPAKRNPQSDGVRLADGELLCIARGQAPDCIVRVRVVPVMSCVYDEIVFGAAVFALRLPLVMKFRKGPLTLAALGFPAYGLRADTMGWCRRDSPTTTPAHA